MEIWRVESNVRFRDGKPRTPITYQNPGRAKEPSLAEQLRAHYKSPTETRRLVGDFESYIRVHLRASNEGEAPLSQNLHGRALSVELMCLLARVWLDDPNTLKDFLSTMFDRWRKIDDPTGVYRRRMAIHQMSPELGHDCKRLQMYLESSGVVKRVDSAPQEIAARNLIAQHLSRDLRKFGNRSKRNQ